MGWSCDPLVVMTFRGVELGSKRAALVLTILMVTLPWTASIDSELSSIEEDRRATQTFWGGSGSNDTGWIDLVATGADPENGTYAYADLILDFAPGAEISNLTFEIAVNGSAGYWATEPQLTLLNTQTPILDWRGYGDLGRQDTMENNPPTVLNGTLDTYLRPNSISDASWELPAGVTLTDMVIEALRPADPKVSFSPQDVIIHDSAINPFDGRLYILLDDDLLHLDTRAAKAIIDIESNVLGRSLGIDQSGSRLLIGTANGSVLTRSLIDSAILPEIKSGNSTEPIISVTSDNYGTIWAASVCTLSYLTVDSNDWGIYDFCQTGASEVPSDILIISDTIYLATTGFGVHLIDYTTNVGNFATNISVNSNTVWNTQNNLVSNKITDLDMLGNQLLIATSDAGINRRDTVSESWLSTWSTSNWLSSNEIHGLSVTSGWLHILAGSTVQAYNTNSLIFQSQQQISDIGLTGNPESIISWPAHSDRGPSKGMSLISDGSGKLVEYIETTTGDQINLISSPSIETMEVVAHIEDGAQGEIWVAGNDVINRFDKSEQIWKNPIEISDYITDPGPITAIQQDANGKIWFGTTNAGILRLDVDGSYMGTVGGIASTQVSDLSYDSTNGYLVIGHPTAGISIIDTNAMALVDTVTTSDGLDSDSVRSVATRFGIAYLATEDAGVMRVAISNSSIMGSWQSLGADDLDATPVAVDGDIVYLGLYDFGILVIDRITGDITEFWNDDAGTLPDDDVLSLEMDDFGGLLVGARGEMSRYDGVTWTNLPGSGQWWNTPSVFYDVTSDGDGIYAGTNRGACKWNWQYQFQDCVSTGEGLESRFVYSIEMIGSDRAYTGGNEGAGIVDMGNFSVIDTWTAGDNTQRARTVEIDNILYLGFENTGIARFDLTAREWLTTWDGGQGYINDDDVTILIPGPTYGTLLAGGDFGFTLIDVVNDNIEWNWDRQSDLPDSSIPADAVIFSDPIIGDILHYSEQRSTSWWGGSSDEIHRINITGSTPFNMASIDTDDTTGWSGVVNSIGIVQDELFIGVRPTNNNNGDGTIVRWNMTNESWGENLPTIGNVLRVNARFLGDCFPLNTSSCELWVAYGDNTLRRFNANTMTLLNEWNDISGPIRGMVDYQGEYLFASMDGILRWNPNNQTWLDSWLPSDIDNDWDDRLYTMKIVGNDLWVGSYSTSGWNRDAHVIQKNGTTGNWTGWELGTAGIPDGYPADIQVCDNIVHIAIGRYSWWGNQGGVARFDLLDSDNDGISNEWLTSFTEGNNNGLSDNDPRALACDENNRILYIGYDTEGVGFDRFNYANKQYLPILNSNDGVGTDRIFPGGMLHHNNVLLAAHQYDGVGGITRIVTSGTATTNGQILDPGMDACSIDIAPSNSGQTVYAVGRSGQTTGLNRVDRLESSGLIVSGFDELAGLASGRVMDIISNDTHVWISSALDQNSYYGSSVLQGQILSNGSVRWEYGYNFQLDIVSEMHLEGETLWVTTAGRGLKSIDLQQRRISSTAPALHSQMDGIILENGTMYVGLMGREGSSAGFQSFTTSSNSWGFGSLIAGLPSNIVRDFLEYGDHILIATHGGIGMWNTTRDDWDDPITTIDGLPSSIIEHLSSIPSPIQGGGQVLAGGAAGVTVLEQNNLTVLTTLTFQDGLMGNSVSGIDYAGPVSRIQQNPDGTNTTIYHDSAIFIAHSGLGPTRPGVAAWDIATDRENGTYNVDMIPSNDVRTITADDWGVHIATDTAPIVHWNGTKQKMETGVGENSLLSWPPFEIHSDGNNLVVMSPSGIDVIDAKTTHSLVRSKEVTGMQSGFLDSSGLYVVGEDGLHYYKPITSMQEMPREYQRRAEPLTVLYANRSWDITDTTHPGMSTFLVTPEDPIQIPEVSFTAAPTRLPMHVGTMTMSAPQGGSWIWARSSSLNYTGSWDMASTNGGIQQAFQSAISAIGPGSGDAILQLQLQSPANGSIQVRLTYDWQRIEVPTVMTSLADRPNDGGGVLTASWLPAEDAAWSAYRLYVWDSTDDPVWVPEKEDLRDMPNYVWSNFWSQTNATITQANHDGQIVSLEDDRTYRAAIAIEYADGSVGEPMTFPLNATPTDEVPEPPEWLNAYITEGGIAGTVNLEWSTCTQIDLDRTRIWAVQQEISSAIGLTGEYEFHWSTGNNTILQLEAGVPYWFAAVCVDEAGQSDIVNATIVGPVVTAGGLDDGIPPSPITGTSAIDVPNDEGGRLNVSWEKNLEEDCTYYAVYALPASGWQPPSTVEGWPVSAYTSDCETTSVIIDSLGTSGLVDGTVYWIGVVAFDDWGNSDVDNVLIVEATPESDFTGVAVAPDRVTGLNAWDHFPDDGSAIDIRWNRSSAEDFNFYTVWISEYPLDNVTILWELCRDSPISCGLLTVDQRQFGADFQLELTATKALYGNNIESLIVDDIQPMVPLYVTVTIHDIGGNVYLDQLSDHMVLVTPIDNRGDVSPPDRILPAVLTDRPDDSGDAMYIDFQASDASDIAEYLIYAVIDTPVLLERIEDLQPALVIDREDFLPVLLTQFSAYDSEESPNLVPNRRIYISVVAVDSSGNAWTDNLATSWIELKDELSADPCPECPDVSGIRANWNSAGTLIEVTWDASDNPLYGTYHAYVSEDSFDDTRNATLVKAGMRDTILILNEFEDAPLLREETYWIEIVTFDGEIHTFYADPIEIPPWSEATFGTDQSDDDSAGDSWVERVIAGDMNMVLAILSVIMILVGGALFIKPRGDSAPAPWEMGAIEVEIEEALEREAAGLSEDEDFGIDDLEKEDGLVANAKRKNIATSDSIDSDTFNQDTDDIADEFNQPQSPDPSVMDELMADEEEELSLDDLDDLADDLDLGDVSDSEDVDTSFLDEML